MRSGELVVSSDSRRLDSALHWISDRSGDSLVVAPVKGAADDLVRQAALSGDGLVAAERFSAMGLAAVIAAPRLARLGLATLGTLGERALAARVVHRLAERGSLAYFAPVSGFAGFPGALASTLSELRMAEASLPESAQAPMEDIRRAVVEYEQQLAEMRLVDLARLLEEATKALESGESVYAGRSLLLLDPLVRCSRLERFLKVLIQRADEVLVTWPAFETPHDWIAGMKLTARELTSCKDGAPSELEALRQNLFQRTARVKVDTGDRFEFFSAPGESRECVEIARRAVELAGQGVPLDEMGIFLRDVQLYQPHLEDALERAGLTAYFAGGTARPDPAGRALLALIDCRLENLSAARFAEYLSLAQLPPLEVIRDGRGQIPWVAPGDEAQLTFRTEWLPSGESSGLTESIPMIPARWEKLLVEASVVGGLERWRRRLSGLERELQLKLNSMGEEDPHIRYQQRRLENVRSLKEYALPLVGQLAEFPDEALWGDWLQRLRDLADSSLVRPESCLSTLAEMAPMAEVGPVGLDEVRDVLGERLGSLRVEPPDHRYGRIFVGPLEAAAARSFTIVFIPGLSEGIFPRRSFEDPLLLDSLRERIGAGLPLRRDRILEERQRLRFGVSAARSRLIVSYPRLDPLQGRARVPSLYALELLRAAEGRMPDLKEVEARSHAEVSGRLGWPAPEDPQRSLDDAEYDLSTLQPLLFSSDAGASKGQARYLMEVNPWLARSVRNRFKRWSRRWTDDDGIVAPREKEVRDLLARHRLNKRSYSPTALQNYAVCPYRFFLYAVQRLQPREQIEVVERMDPLVRGSLFHETQFKLFGRLESEGLLPVQSDHLEQILDLADLALNEVAGRYREELAPALPTVWRDEVEELRVDLRSWIREMMTEKESWRPFRWELSFGLPIGSQRDVHSILEPVPLGKGYQARGAIDLVERNTGRNCLRVTDHKTGGPRKPRPEIVGGGEVLQPLLYALAAEAIFEEPVECGQLFYSTQRGGFQRHFFPLNERSRKTVLEVLDTIDDALDQAFIPAAPRPEACHYCDYRPICGPYEELRVSLKDLGRLKPLVRLRSLP